MAAQINIPQALHLNVISDTICPWCYVGKRHLEGALPILATEGLTHGAPAWPKRRPIDRPRRPVSVLRGTARIHDRHGATRGERSI
jgi:hypothetical protein